MILRCQLVSLLKGVIIFFLKCRTHRKIGKCITVALENPGTMDPAGFRRRLPAMIWERCIGLDRSTLTMRCRIGTESETFI
jgi:hypothetical protein